MSEATPHKRVLPARERTESITKRQASSPAGPSTPATEPRVKRAYTKRGTGGTAKKPSTLATGTPTPSTPVEEILPTKLQPSKPLPTTSQKSPDKLSNREYQSIAESTVLAASLHRSRMQWLCEGVFQRYWTKPSKKKKGVSEQLPGNPDAKSMTRLGNATMTIEPHIFDVTFWTVKEAASAPPAYYRHPNQHTAKQSQPSLPPPPVVQQTARSHPPPAPTSFATPSKPPTPATPSTTHHIGSTSTKQETAGIGPQVKRETSTTQTKSTNLTPSFPTASAPPKALVHPPVQSVAPISTANGPTRPPNDPVIQMLAARAAVNERLRELMKDVATSQATTEQLREFQAHIDEFNKVIKQQEAKKAEEERNKHPPASGAVAHPASHSGPSRPHPGPPTSIGGPMHMAPPAYASYPPPRSEPFIKHIVIEFHSPVSATMGSSTDRWLFPEHAVLDIRSGGLEMIASFFVVRKGEDVLKRMNLEDDKEGAVRQKFKSDVEYFQPVTVTIKATAHKIIETIARAAKPLTECQSHMKDVMEHKTRAPREYLVHQLPRDKVLADATVTDFVDSAVEMSDQEDDELKDVYSI